MKNLKVGKKFLVSFGSILVLLLTVVVISTVGMTRSKASYQRFYEKDYQALCNIFEIRISLQRTIKELLLSVITTDETESEQRVSTAEQHINNIQTYLQQTYSLYEGDTTHLKEFESLMKNNSHIRLQVIEYSRMGTEEGNQLAQEMVLKEYNPLVERYVDALQKAFDQMEAECQDSYEMAMKMENGLIFLSLAIALISFCLTLVIALSLTKSILTPVKKIESVMNEMVKGNLSEEVDYRSEDEFGLMAHAMRDVTRGVGSIIKDIEMILSAMGNGDFTVHSSAPEKYVGDYHKIYMAMKLIKENFNGTLTTLNHSADQVSSGSDQVSSGAQALSQGATEQASSVEELAASINEISGHINKNAQNAQEAGNKAVVVGNVAGESNRRMQDMLNAMSDINAASGEIGKIIKTIEDIAFQTNILALNAAVEAARAGAAGKGFAVVADEVRNLASKSASASNSTSELIQGAVSAVDKGRRIAHETADSLMKVVDSTQTVSGIVDQIAMAAAQQSHSLEQVTEGMNQISSVVHTNSATAEESAATSEELSSQAQVLRSLVGQFKLMKV